MDGSGGTGPTAEPSQDVAPTAVPPSQTMLSPYDTLPSMTQMVRQWAAIAPQAPLPAEAWPAALSAMQLRWAELVAAPPGIEHWALELARMTALQRQLVEGGQWVTGPRDFFGVMGLTGFEQCHSRMVAWLLDPNHRHGLGPRFLRRLLERHWGDDAVTFNLGTARAQCEVTRRSARLDIVVWADDLTLVIENKVGAAEGKNQCDYYYRLFRREPGARFMFLSPSGTLPKSATGAALEAFKPVSYRDIRACLAEVLQESTDDPPGSARDVAEHYLRTLEVDFPMVHPTGPDGDPVRTVQDTQARFYLEHQELIQEWARLATPASAEADRFMHSLWPDFERLAAEVGATLAHGQRSEQCFLLRERWLSSGLVVASVVVEWDKGSVAFVGPGRARAGIYLRWAVPQFQPLYDHLVLQTTPLRGQYGYTKGKQYPAYRSLPAAEGDYWDDLEPYSNAILDSVRETWQHFADHIDRAIDGLGDEGADGTSAAHSAAAEAPRDELGEHLSGANVDVGPDDPTAGYDATAAPDLEQPG